MIEQKKENHEQQPVGLNDIKIMNMQGGKEVFQDQIKMVKGAQIIDNQIQSQSENNLDLSSFDFQKADQSKLEDNLATILGRLKILFLGLTISIILIIISLFESNLLDEFLIISYLLFCMNFFYGIKLINKLQNQQGIDQMVKFAQYQRLFLHIGSATQLINIVTNLIIVFYHEELEIRNKVKYRVQDHKRHIVKVGLELIIYLVTYTTIVKYLDMIIQINIRRQQYEQSKL